MYQQCNPKRFECGLYKLQRNGAHTTSYAARTAQAARRCGCCSNINRHGWDTINHHTYSRCDIAHRCRAHAHTRAWPGSSANTRAAPDWNAQTGTNAHAAPDSLAHVHRGARSGCDSYSTGDTSGPTGTYVDGRRGRDNHTCIANRWLGWRADRLTGAYGYPANHSAPDSDAIGAHASAD
jgi:hypothetical protein